MNELTTITQSYTMYDTTGIIEPDKRVYFVPSKEEINSKVGKKVSVGYVEIFNLVCPQPYNDYVNVELSRWQPEDRTLTVKGNIDMFRRGSSMHIMNYMILKRDVSYGVGDSRNYSYYTGYFIRSAIQTGMDSVQLSLEPDNFTNVFYLHNTNTITNDYEPFNVLLKNCYVERQHYERIGKLPKGITLTGLGINDKYVYGESYAITKDAPSVDTTILTNNRFNLFRVSATGEKELIDEYMNISYNQSTGKFRFYSIVPIGQEPHIYEVSASSYDSDNSYYLVFEFTEYGAEYSPINQLLTAKITISEEIGVKNTDILYTQKETFNYKLQRKDSKKPLVIYIEDDAVDAYTRLEEIPDECIGMDSQQAENYILSATPAQLKTIASACVGYIHILCKDRITYPTIFEPTGLSLDNKFLHAFYGVDMEYKGVISSPQQHLVIPFIKEVKGLEAFTEYFNEQGIHIDAYNTARTNTFGVKLYNNKDVADALGVLQEKFGYYIQSIYVTPYSELSKAMVVEGLSTKVIRFRGDLFSGAIPSKYANATKFEAVDSYDSRAISKPTITLLSYDKIETTCEVGNKIPSSANDFLKGFINGIDYWLSTFQRKNLHTSEKFESVPVACFSGLTTYDSASDTYSIDNIIPANTAGIMLPAFIVGRKGFDEIDYDFNDVIIPSSLKSRYYEPSLNVEPYSLLTLSFLESESTIQKKRLLMKYTFTISQAGNIVTSSKLRLKYNQNINAQFKFGVIPAYEIDNYIRNYNDALVYISADSLIVRNNSYYEYTYQQNAMMSAQRYLASLNGAIDLGQYVVNDIPYNIGSGATQGGWMGAIRGTGQSIRDVGDMLVDYAQDIYNTKVMQEASLAGAGAKADNYKSAGSDLIYDLNNNEFMLYINKYKIDDLSYNSISKMLERYGYKVDIYDKLNVYDRVGWNYIKLREFDFAKSSIDVSDEQATDLLKLFADGVTLLHKPNYITQGLHNYESVLDEIES